MPSFARELEQTLHNALGEASKRRHEYATLEHLLMALIDDEHGSKVMTACGVNRDELTGANVLVALFSERESYAVYFLQQQDMSRLDAVTYISHGVGKGDAAPEPREVNGTEEKGEQKEGKKESALAQFTVNLNDK